MIVDIITRDLTNPERVDRRRVNYARKQTREWLNDKHIPWALDHGQSVTIAPFIAAED